MAMRQSKIFRALATTCKRLHVDKINGAPARPRLFVLVA